MNRREYAVLKLIQQMYGDFKKAVDETLEAKDRVIRILKKNK